MQLDWADHRGTLISNPYIACKLTDPYTLEELAKRFPEAFQEDGAKGTSS